MDFKNYLNESFIFPSDEQHREAEIMDIEEMFALILHQSKHLKEAKAVSHIQITRNRTKFHRKTSHVLNYWTTKLYIPGSKAMYVLLFN